jgi:ATP-dependent DNA ligase
VIGYVPAEAAIRLARREEGGLVYAGKAGTGFSMESAQDARARLEPFDPQGCASGAGSTTAY